MTKEVYKILSPHGYEFEEETPLLVKGKSEPILTHFLVGRPKTYPELIYREFDK